MTSQVLILGRRRLYKPPDPTSTQYNQIKSTINQSTTTKMFATTALRQMTAVRVNASRTFASSAFLRKSVTDTIKDAAKTVDRAAAEAALKGIEATQSVADAAKSAASSITNTSAAQKAAEAASELKNVAPDVISGKSKEAAGQIKGKLAEAKGELKGAAAQVKGKANEGAAEVKGKVNEGAADQARKNLTE
ncbi:hypothetical protein SAICODRAFT_109499 [Saitoella complicata NRRL Y-17804]|uniref:uncharacterized protein n=1 Tax=Saitoella complicata (strain BCRC 22490 / CBS 7301 / JCM 7358 / NBRC 10748 / NRRL Y-17804) TaxID=698492 RepID=UPI000866AD79|nr:uncharacterized protein SAICODRAFT_109499 [Saitoella complicata NRRL Y-17804]ODQ56488.1 hypothetical protein SAICODRAFT_109499 [Saitoella complicata NRRL Y-17804]